MGILILMLIIATGALAVLVFTSPKQLTPKTEEEKEPAPQNKTEHDMQTVLISSLEEQLFSLKDESERIKAEYVGLQEELEETKKREFSLREELLRQNDWYDKKVEELEKLKSEYLPIKSKLEKEFSEGVDFNREIKEKDDLIESLRSENKQMADEIKELRAQIERNGKQV